MCNVSSFEFMNVFWFQIFLGVMGILVLTRGILFKLDSSIFAGISLILVAIILVIKDYYALPFNYMIAPIFASISIGLICAYALKNRLYLKLFLYSLIFVALACIGYAF